MSEGLGTRCRRIEAHDLDGGDEGRDPVHGASSGDQRVGDLRERLAPEGGPGWGQRPEPVLESSLHGGAERENSNQDLTPGRGRTRALEGRVAGGHHGEDPAAGSRKLGSTVGVRRDGAGLGVPPHLCDHRLRRDGVQDADREPDRTGRAHGSRAELERGGIGRTRRGLGRGRGPTRAEESHQGDDGRDARADLGPVEREAGRRRGQGRERQGLRGGTDRSPALGHRADLDLDADTLGGQSVPGNGEREGAVRLGRRPCGDTTVE